jgi:O-antigen ligase
MLKTLLICIAVILGVCIPLVGHMPQFHYLLAAVVVSGVLLVVLRTRITMFDLVALYALFIPLQQFRIGTGQAFLRPTELAVVLLSALWLTNRLVSGDFRRLSAPLEFSLLACFVASSCLSITRSLYPAISIYRTVILTYLIIFAFIVFDIMRDKDKLLRIVRILIAVAAMAGLVGIMQSLLPFLSPFYRPEYAAVRVGPINLYRASAGWDNPNYFALFLTLVLPITISMLFSREFAKEKMFLSVCLLLQFLGLLSTLSRNGMITFIAGVLFLLWMYRRHALAILIVGLTVIMVTSVWIGRETVYKRLPPVYAFFVRVPLDTVERNPELILSYRLDAWKANVAMFQDNPLLGVGPFMAGDNYIRYRPADSLYPKAMGKLEPHCEFLSLLSERGLIGFFFFASFLIILLWRSIQTAVSAPFGLRAVLIGLCASLFSFSVASVGEATLTQTTFWLLVGLTLSARQFPELKNETLHRSA